MARDMKDVVEAEAQRRYTDLLASANLDALGIGSSRVATEVLFMLPGEFVRAYKELFEMALSWSPQTPGGGGKDEGKIKASGKTKGGKGEQGMHTREMGPAKSGGKRYTHRHFAIKSEAAVRAKSRLDRRLVRAADDAIRAARAENAEATDEISVGRGNGDRRANGPLSGKRECGDCGRKLANGWVRCPFHADERER